MAKERSCYTSCHYAFAGRVLVRMLGFRIAPLLGIGNLKVRYVNNSFQLGHVIKKVHHRVIGAIDFDFEWHLGVKILARSRLRRVPSQLDAGFCSFGIQVIDHDAILAVVLGLAGAAKACFHARKGL